MMTHLACEVIDAASAGAVLPSAVALLGAQFEEHKIHIEPDALASTLRALLNDPTRGALIVAHSFADDVPHDVAIGIAALAYTLTLEHGGLVAWLDELYVMPKFRDQGVGRALLRFAIEVAQRAGARALELEVSADHARAERLYEREGFHRLARARWSRTL